MMLKQSTSVYRPGSRTKCWLKVKPTERATFTITGWKHAIRGPHGSTVLQDDEGVVTSVGTPNEILIMADHNADALMGRRVIVKYTCRSTRGSYRHPRADLEKTLKLWRKKYDRG